MELCPTADDTWIWAVARVAGNDSHCIGTQSGWPIRRQARTRRLRTINRGEGHNDVQLERAIDYFELEVD